jgi:hypothetical protein
MDALCKVCEDNRKVLDRDYQGQRPLDRRHGDISIGISDSSQQIINNLRPGQEATVKHH